MDRNIKITIQYDGTNYAGWQIQPNANTVQEEIEKSLGIITKEQTRITGSGRTDTGVHALGQVANFYTKSSMAAEKFVLAMNSILPEDIVVLKAEDVAEEFHSRYHAKGKHYSYSIYNAKIPKALGRQYHWHIKYDTRLDIDKMREAAKYFIGEHDFIGFMSTGSSVKTTIRELYSIEITEQNKEITIDYKGNGFLYNMVRILTGTLVDCGIGKIKPEEIPQIILQKNRKKAGVTAPAKGLKLIEVFY